MYVSYVFDILVFGYTLNMILQWHGEIPDFPGLLAVHADHNNSLITFAWCA